MSPSPSRRVALAVDALRHGWPLAVECAAQDGSQAETRILLPVETAIATQAKAEFLLLSLIHI